MAKFRISGVWKNENGAITHYAFHSVKEGSVSRADKISKANAIKIVETPGNNVFTWIWNYTSAKWKIGETVKVVDGQKGKYLRSNPDDTLTDNLEHLIDYDWIIH